MALVLPFLISKEPQRFHMNVYINVTRYPLNKVLKRFPDGNDGRYPLNKVPKRFPDGNDGIILYFLWIIWRNVNTVRQFGYWLVSISQFEKTPVKEDTCQRRHLSKKTPVREDTCQRRHLSRCCMDWSWPIVMFSLSSKTVNKLHWGLFFIDAAMMCALGPLEMTMYVHIYISPLHFYQPSDRYELITYGRPMWLLLCRLIKLVIIWPIRM